MLSKRTNARKKPGHRILSALLTAVMVFSICLAGMVQNTVEAQASSSVTVYRVYNPDNGEHLYTLDANEVNVLTTNYGWQDEGTGWYAPTSGTAVYRLYNNALLNHLYTTDENEVKTLLKDSNWTIDNNGNPVFYSGGNVGIYRLYNRGLQGQHLLTTDSNEYSVLPSYGWTQEGTALYAEAFSYTASGAFGFFRYLSEKGDEDATAALEILNTATYASSTTEGNAKDATSLTNMQRAISFIKECNELRTANGLSELNVSYQMMAIAMSNLNWSSVNMAHSSQFSVAENLAWGYSDPFYGWYYMEKINYEEQNGGETGHYLNVINNWSNVTGFAVSQYGSYGISHGQVFSYSTDSTMTVEEFEASLNAYIKVMETK